MNLLRPIALLFALLVPWLSAQGAPTVVAQPASRSILAGGDTTFAFEVTPSVGTTYQWSVSTNQGTTWTALTNSGPYSGVTGPVLTVTGATVGLSGLRYRCTASNSGAVTSSDATLWVAVPLAAGGDAVTLPALAMNQTVLYAVTLAEGNAGARFALNTVGPGSADLALQRAAAPTPTSRLKASTAQGIDTLFLTPAEATPATYFVAVTRPAGETGTPAVTLTYTASYSTDLTWDPGTTEEGTALSVSPPANTGGWYYFKVVTQSPAVGAWRSVLNVASGTADLYLLQNNGPTPSSFSHKSERPGTAGDGFVLPSAEFAAAQTWYLLVVASQNAQWSLVSGAAYVKELGTVAADGSSGSGNVTIGPEGHRFFRTSTPANAAAWRVWLNNGAATPATLADTKVAVRRTAVPFVDGGYDHQQLGHMLLVPPYLNTGGDTYFLSVSGPPGMSFNLDSRIAPVTDVPFGSSADFTLPASGYAVFRTDVPVDQIGWQTMLSGLTGNVDLAVRRDNAASEFFNDAFSEVAGTVGDSVTLVPPVLTNGTYYITLYNAGTAASGQLTSRVPFSSAPDDVTFLGSTLNDEPGNAVDDPNPNKAGWRYFRVGAAVTGGIESQLGKLGWQLQLSGAPAGAEIALRRNNLPGKWQSRSGFSQSFGAGSASSYFQEVNSGGTALLQRPGHPADVWYIGVFSGAAALGNFTLDRTALVPAAENFVTNLAAPTTVANQVPGAWRYFKIEVPDDASLLGWDLRVLNVSGGAVQAAVARGALPGDGLPADFPLGRYWSRPNAPDGGDDGSRYLLKAVEGRSPTAQESGFLYAGTYYLGVKNAGTTPMSYELQSRGVGTPTSSHAIKVGDLSFTDGTATISGLAPRELALYRVTVPAGAKSWRLKLAPDGTGEASLKIGRNFIPGTVGSALTGTVWRTLGKSGKEWMYLARTADSDTSTLDAGAVYYLAVDGEGNAPADANRVGTGAIAATLTGTSDIPVDANLGLAGPTERVQAVSLEAAEIKLYQFTVAPGTFSVQVQLTERTGSPRFTLGLGPEPFWSAAALAGDEPYASVSVAGGRSPLASGETSPVVLPNPAAGVYTVAVRAGTAHAASTANLRVLASVPVQVDAEFSDSTTAVVNQPAGDWRYFKFEVPADAALLGWDLRVLNVSGGNVQAHVLRDARPVDGSGGDFMLNPYWSRTLAANGTDDGSRYLLKSVEQPGPTAQQLQSGPARGWLYPGTYYLGMKNVGTTAMSYTVRSRGVGLATASYPIKVQDLAFANGTAAISGLAPRELAIYRVTVPAGAKSWHVKLTPAGPGEASLKIGLNSIPANAPNFRTGDLWRTLAKTGNELLYVARTADNDTTTLAAGAVYYLAVDGEGNSPADVNRVGTGNISATLTSTGDIAAPTSLGTAGTTEVVQAVNLEAGEIKLYSFTVAPDTFSLRLELTERTGVPVFALGRGAEPFWSTIQFREDGGYGSQSVVGGRSPQTHGITLPVVIPNPLPGTYTVAVRAAMPAGATANLRVVTFAPVQVDADFSDSTTAVVSQPAGDWRYFKFQVPADEALLGWDLRVVNVTGGQAQAVVVRDALPVDGLGTDFELTGYWSRSAAADGAFDGSRYLLKSLEKPGPTAQQLQSGPARAWLYPGTYYLGVKNTGATAMSYTVRSRGVGLAASSFPIKAQDLAFTNGTAAISELAPRELALYRVTVPVGAKSWRVKLTPAGTGEASLKIGLNSIPANAFNLRTGQYTWRTLGKPGAEFLYAARTADSDTATLEAGAVYYLAVDGEGNSPVNESRIGTGTIAATLTSTSDMPVTADLGVAGATETVQAVSLEGAEIQLYQFTVAPGTIGVELRLTERTGAPRFAVGLGTEPVWGPNALRGIDEPYHGSSILGGRSPLAVNDATITLTNPVAGIYTIAVRALNPYPNLTPVSATANLRLKAKVPRVLNFSASQNAGGGSNADTPALPISDQERALYEVTIPAQVGAAAPLGWKLSLNTTQGSPTLFVYNNPANLTAPAAQTSGSTLILAPPLFARGTWIVEVRGGGATSYTLTSEAVTIRNAASPWVLPTAAAYSSAADFGDTGSVSLANGDYDFYAVTVPEGNLGVLRTVIEAISGNPDLYVRRAAIPSHQHAVPASGETPGGVAYERALVDPTGSEYANWVPWRDRTEAQLRPGTYYLAVHAAGNTNVTYRLRVSPGAVQTLPLAGGNLPAQFLAARDWRYYRVTIPTDGPGAQAWTVNFAKTSGDVVMFVRDAVPPGFSTNTTVGSAYGQDQVYEWQRDEKNSAPALYGRYSVAGSYTFTTPALRPGSTYYLGFYARTDANFDVASSATGTLAAVPAIDYYTGTLTNVAVPAGGNVLYRMVAPADAGRLKFALTPTAPIELTIEQGSVPTAAGGAHYRSPGWGPTAGSFDQVLSNWPWVPGTTYYLRIANPSASPVTFSLASDSGRAAILQPPVAQVVAAGETATFSVVAGGSPAPAYVWKKNGVALTDGGRFAGTTTATLTITGAITADTGTYVVDVSNTTGTGPFTVSAGAALSVSGAPLITTQPADVTAAVGSTAQFSVAAYSYTTPSYRWQSSDDGGTTWTDLADAGSVSGSATAQLQIAAVTAALSGRRYRVVVTNAIGVSSSSAATLLVNAPPAITSQPAGQTVGVGSAFAFSVVATGIPAPTYQWRKNNTAIPSATAATLTGASAQLSDAGSYTVRVTNTLGFVDSAAVDLVVIEPPAITTQPTGAARVVGEAHTLAVVATGTPPLSYQWRRNGTPLSGATQATLALTNLQLADAGDYSVVVTNAAGSATSAVAAVAVAPAPAAPTITTPPVNVAVVAGQAASFTVAATGTPAPGFQWQRRAAGAAGFVNLTEGGAYAGVASATLTVTAVSAAMHGDQFRVVASNGVGAAAISATATLAVNLPPVFGSANSATFVVGVANTFTVAASGRPAPVYSIAAGALPAWATLDAASGVIAGTPPDTTGAPFTLTLRASNGIPPEATQAFVLAVASAVPPVIATGPAGRAVSVGSAVTFGVVATGTAPLSYQWRRDGTPLAGATASTFAISAAQLTDAGVYTVAVTNPAGTVVSAPAGLSVVEAVASHTVLGPGYTGGGTVTISTTLTYGGTVTALGWQVLLPPGFSFVTDGGSAGNTKPAAGSADLLEWAWTTVPPSPVNFTYTLAAGAGLAGDKQLGALAILRLQGAVGPVQLLAKPDPLTVPEVTVHSADTDRNYRIDLAELTRVIQLYNTRFVAVRTGAYAVDATGEDGFRPEPTRPLAAGVALERYHAADSDRNGRIGLVELTRVIELYNYRVGTSRTGEYHVQAGSEDGFNPGP